MKSMIGILDRERRLIEDINALIQETKWQTDEVELDRLYIEKESKEKELATVRDELREYFEVLFRKES